MELDWEKFPADNYEAAKIFALEYYRQIVRIKSPILNNEFIYFNHKGIGHILHKANRGRSEIIERLRCLRYVEVIIKDSSVEIEYRRHDEKEYLSNHGTYKLCEVSTQYWTLKMRIMPSLSIKVVIRQVGNGNKYFYSIFKSDHP